MGTTVHQSNHKLFLENFYFFSVAIKNLNTQL